MAQDFHNYSTEIDFHVCDCWLEVRLTVLSEDRLYLAVNLLLENDSQQLQSLPGVCHHGVLASCHCNLQIMTKKFNEEL